MSDFKDGCAGCTEVSEETDPEETPTNFWHCVRCGAHLNRYRGQGDQSCVCGTEYNIGGQRLRDDWRDNPAWQDDSVDDLEGFELSQLAKESHEDSED